ncbi:MAG: hypothetical protein NNA23_02110 [Nitrospira sp.]|nr:hypothetical protein [Nitrospira sp.]
MASVARRWTIGRLAESGVPGAAGDGGPVLRASLNGDQGSPCSPDGNVLIVEAENHVIRRVD